MLERIQLHPVWLNADNADLNPSRAIRAGVRALQRLVELGIEVPPENRLRSAIRLLERTNIPGTVILPEDDDLLVRLADAQRTILEQVTIVRATPGPERLSPTHRFKLTEMLGGADIEDEERNPLARNTQFELYVGATFAMGDAWIMLEEPDLRLQYAGRDVGIAAKRIRSPAQLRRRTLEAAEQIDRAGGGGFVALNLDILVKGMSLEAVAESERNAFNSYMEPLHKVEKELAERHHVLGTLVFANTAQWSFEGGRPRFHIATYRRFWPLPQSEEDLATFQQFTEALLPNLSVRSASIYGV